MPIITQLNATKLRSLKYGNDTSDGGNSGQPYMKVSLKDVDKGFTKLRLTKFDDGLIRGGAVGALNASVVDTLRIGKFLTDFPKGPLFLAKQVGLQLSNPKLESRKGVSGFLSNIGSTRLYNLGINTIAQVPLNAFGGHLMRHGLLPVMDESTKYINVVTENNKVVNDNRLVALTNKFNLGDGETEVSQQFNLQEARKANRLTNRQGRQANRAINQSTKQGAKTEGFEFHRIKFKRNKLDTSTLTIDSYNGGPKSVYGIGRTIINRYAFTEDKIKIDEAYDHAKIETIRGSLSVNPLTEISGFNNGSGSYVTASLTTDPISIFPLITANPVEDDQFKVLSRNKSPKDFIYNGGNVPESELQQNVGDGNIKINAQNNITWAKKHTPQVNPIVSTSPDKFEAVKRSLDFEPDTKKIKFVDENPTYIGGTRVIANAIPATVDATDPNNPVTVAAKRKTVKASIVNVTKNENLKNIYEKGEMADAPVTSIGQVIDNGGDIFFSEDISVNRNANGAFYFNGDKTVPNFDRVDSDLLRIDFDPINPSSAKEMRNVRFSAYMNGFKSNVSSTWNPVKYVGRSESFYIFNEFKRDVSFNLQIPCFNKEQLTEKHRALGELQAVGAGRYDDANRLGGIIIKVNLGNYLYNEMCILTSLSFDIPNESSWDLDNKLAMYINAQFSFIVLGKELPSYVYNESKPLEGQGGFFNYLPDVNAGYLQPR